MTTTDRTGVEMEALTAVSVAALTVIDMVKAVDKAAVITDVRVETKTGRQERGLVAVTADGLTARAWWSRPTAPRPGCTTTPPGR